MASSDIPTLSSYLVLSPWENQYVCYKYITILKRLHSIFGNKSYLYSVLMTDRMVRSVYHVTCRS